MDSYWRGLLEGIKGQVTDLQFDTWFRSVEPRACTTDLLELWVPNSFSREWLTKKYSGVILGAAERANGGHRPALRLTVREDAGALPREPQEPVQKPAVRTEEVRSRAQVPPGSVSGWLNPNYSLDRFVVGSCNQLAHAAAVEVSTELSASRYNPLFVHGAVGLGKSHLAQGIALAWQQKRPEAKVRYLPCEQFINLYISAVEQRDLPAFRRRMREVELLVVDDVQFLGGKDRSQEEFFHCFQELLGKQARIVLAADQPPTHIPGLSDRLVSCFRWGLVCDLRAPDYTTRRDLVRQKASQLGASMPEEVAAFIAQNVTRNVRELEGAVTRVVGHGALTGREVEVGQARMALQDLVVDNARRVSVEDIISVVSERYGLKPAELRGRRRTQVVAGARHACMHFARLLTDVSLGEIGSHLGGRDHTTVLYGIDRFAERLRSEPGLQEVAAELELAIRNRVRD